MQRYWSAPAADEATLSFQTRELATWCRSYNPAHLRAAYAWLKEHYGYKTWPKIADWKRAVEATAKSQAANENKDKTPPWQQMMQKADRVADAEMDSPLGRDAISEGWGRELRDAYKRLAYDALVKGDPTDNLIVSSKSIAWWRKKAASEAEAAAYHRSPEYLERHGVPYRPA